jgi:hypothetical protein
MRAKATVRVRPTDGSALLPEKFQLERAAEVLKAQGFDVLRLGRAGVNVEGDASIFEQELGVNVERPGGIVAKVKPKEPEHDELFDSVEIAPSPSSFDNS